MPAPEAVLVTGTYGSGKTTVVAEMAELIERRGLRYAALDLDWLAWGWPGDDEGEMAEHRLMLENLELVVSNYRRRGNDRFLLAHAIRTAEQMAMLRATLPMPVRVVRLTIPLEEIRLRAVPDTTTGRAGDLQRAEAWLEADDGAGLEDLMVANDRPINVVAMEILTWLGWLRG
jgi:GNAT superfamily N-acetyltransferase